MSTDVLQEVIEEKNEKGKEEKKVTPPLSQIDIKTLFNPLIKGDLYQKIYNEKELESLENEIKKRIEKKEEEKEFIFKERIIYNNLPNECISKYNSDISNIYYYQNFFELKEDFNYRNYLNLVKMRAKYLDTVFQQKEPEKKKEEKKELDKNDTLHSLFTDLADMMNYQHDQGDESLHYSIIERIFSNIFFEIEAFFDGNDLDKHSLYETKLYECIDLLEKKFMAEKGEVNSKNIHLLYQLQKISLSIKSCGAFLWTLKLIKEKNIAFDNYYSISEKYFKSKYTNINIKYKELSKISSKVFDIYLNEDINTFEFLSDNKYIYLCYDCNKSKKYQLEKYNLSTGEKSMEKEISKYLDICMLNDYKKDKINLLTYKEENEFELLILNKNDFSIEESIKIASPIKRSEYVQMVTSLNNCYVITDTQIYILDTSRDKAYVLNSFLVLKKRLKKDKSYYFIMDDYINFSCFNQINLQNLTIEDSFEENSKEDERNYFDNYNNSLYSLKYMKGKKIIEVNKCVLDNFILRYVNSNKEIQELKQKLDTNFTNLSKDFPCDLKVDDESDNIDEVFKIDPFKHYLNYSNDIDSLLSLEENKFNDKNKYKIDKDISESYYTFLYFSLLKYYYYSSEKDLPNKNKLIINFNSDVMFNVIKEALKETKDYIILYIYVYFINQNSKVSKNEKFDEKMKWIVDFCLKQEKISPLLFEVLREIYKCNPKYINSANAFNDLIDSTKLSFKEKISYFSLISLKEYKDKKIKLLDQFLSIEKQLILNKKEIMSDSEILFNDACTHFMNYFQNIKSYNFEDNKFWKEFNKIIEVFINNYNSILYEIIEKDSKISIYNSTISNSVCFQVLFLLINILIYQNEKLKKNNKVGDLTKLLLKTFYLLGKYSEQNKIEHNIEKEEILTVRSENFDTPEKIDYILAMKSEKIYMEYNSETNYPYKIKVEALPLFSGTPKDNEQTELNIKQKIKVSNDTKALFLDKKNNYMKFEIKFSNYKNDESNKNILVSMRKSILFYILTSSLANSKSKNNDIEQTSEEEFKKNLVKNKVNQIIKSDFFKNISIISEEKSNIIISDSKSYDFKLNEIVDDKKNSISDEYKNNYTKKIESIFRNEEKENITNSINSTSNINAIKEHLLKNESLKKLMEVIHQEFIKKNKWGMINEELLKQIIISSFSIILYEYNLYDEFEDLAELNIKNNISPDNDKLKIFISIYTKISQLKKTISKKKQDFSVLKDIKEEQEEELLKNYISSINQKLDLIIKNKKRKENSDLNKEKDKLNISNIENTISFLLNFITDDRIDAVSVQKSMEELNEKARNKQNILNYLNKLLFISKKGQDIKDIIFTINRIIRNGKKSLCDFYGDLIGADESLINKYKMQVYIFILQIINKVKEEDSKDYDISYYYTLVQSLFWAFTKNDDKFIQVSQFYEILNDKSKINKFNKLLLSHNSSNLYILNYYEFQRLFRLSCDTLYKLIFHLFKFMSFLAMNYFNDVNYMKENEKTPLLKYIVDATFNVFTNYINDMDDLKNGKKEMNQIINEEKLNSFLMIFYRCILKNKECITKIIQSYCPNILIDLFHVLSYSSTKNKLLVLKIIEILLINNDDIDKSFLDKNIEDFKNQLKEKNYNLYNFIYSKKVIHIENAFVEYLFNFALLLQQNIDNITVFINGTESNMDLSFIIIKILQNKLVKNDNSLIYNQIFKFIESNFANSKFLSLILQILGVELEFLHIGSYIDLKDNKKGIILGFNNNNSEEATNKFKDINYSKGDFVYYIPEDSIYKDYLIKFDLMFDSSDKKCLKVFKNYQLILPLEKNKPIYEYLMENINKYELKDIYLILKYLKMLLTVENIKLSDNVIQYVMTRSLNKEVLQSKFKLITLEKLEKLMLPYICESNPSIFIKDEKISEDDSNANGDAEEPLFVDPYSPDIFIDSTSLCYRCGEEHSLAFCYQYKKILNHNNFVEAKKFLKAFNKVDDIKKYKGKCILMTKNLLDIPTIPKNVEYIIVPLNSEDEEIIKNKITTTPIIMLDDLEYKNMAENTFEQTSFPELENLYMISLQTDYSSSIDIPDERIADVADNQRDTLLEILNEEVSNEEVKKETKEKVVNYIPNYEEFKKVFCNMDINNINKELIFQKLISLISRRMIIIIKMVSKTKIDLVDLKNLIQLLQYENSIENSKDCEIVNIIKNFVMITTIEKDEETIKCFTDISFLDGKNLLVDSKIKDIETESELLKSQNIFNNLFLIDWFFLCHFTYNKSAFLNQQFVFDFIAKLIKQDKNLIASFLLKVFKHIEENIDNYLDSIEKNKEIFYSEEFKKLFDYCELTLNNSLKGDQSSESNFRQSFYELIELFFVYCNITYKLNYKYNKSINTNFENTTLLNIYKIYSLLLYFKDGTKSEINYYNFVELFYQKGLYKYLIDCDQFSKPLKRIKLNYYDKKYNSNFVMNFQNLIPKELENDINSISLMLRKVDNKLVNEENCIFFYESEKCQYLQDYIKLYDRPDDKRILLIKDNITVSYPYQNFNTYLYGAGSNDKNSLGIQINTLEKYSTPQPCVGLEDCKNIIDFKFGYYHTFVQSADGNLFTCGTDKGSSFRYTNVEFPFFNKQTYFHSLAKENGGIKVIAANNFNSSILLTNNNKLFCCGKNNASCLGNSIEGENEIDVPNEMPEFLPLIKEIKYPYIVKEIACGYKSTLFLLEEGYAFTCGSQDFKQCGSKEKVAGYREYFPLYPPRGTKFTHVVSGEEFFLLLVQEVYEKNYGKLYSLGQNEHGRSGVGEININYTLQKIEEVEDKYFNVISSRNENAAAISVEGELYTFGNNSSEALGLNCNKNMFVPTRVDSLSDCVCDNVGISQNHMVIIARDKKTGKRGVYSCGDNQYSALCMENVSGKVHIPTQIKFFLENRPNEEPIRASLSRYQTYLMSIKVDLKDKINKKLDNFKCVKCNKSSQYNIYFNIDENKTVNYYCRECTSKDSKNIYYVLNTINDDTKGNLETLLSDEKNKNDLLLTFEENKSKTKCLFCNTEIESIIYQSYSNENLILCEKCYLSRCPLIEYPQLFMAYNCSITPQKAKNKINVDSIIYPNIVKTESPYLELDVIANYKKEYFIKELFKNKEVNDLYNSTWKLINKNILKEMRKLKEFYEDDKFNYIIETKEDKKEEDKKEEDKKEEDKKEEDKKEEDKKEEDKKEEEKKEDDKKDKKKERKIEYKNYEYLANIAGKSNKYLIYEIITKLIDLKNKTDIKNEDFQNLDLYQKNNKLYYLAFELSNRINHQIFNILELSIRFPFQTMFKKIIESSLEFITSQERREIFQRNIEMDRTSIDLDHNEMVLSRIKANLFYEKNELDKDGLHTVFSQLFRKAKNYPKKNYLSKRGHRLFSVKLQGEGAQDFSGVYNEVISIISFELQSKYLDLFIRTPNNKNEIGLNRDKYMPNPLAKSQLHKDMYYFLGNLMLHSITSGNVLNLDLHPIFYKKLLNHEISFSEIETVDKLSYKFIKSLEAIKTEAEFSESHKDLYFAVHSSSDNSLIDLIKNGQSTKVTFKDLPMYIKLYKEFLINEIDEQVAMIRKGIFDILKEGLSSLLTPEDLEEYICGSPELNLQLLREKTRYDSYESDSPCIINFWKALESFSEEEKRKYLRFVSGRTRLPDPRNISFEHKIVLYPINRPDMQMPTSSTCYFTLNLPNYSTYEILREKLRYVINNCSAIDADFLPDNGGDEFIDE